MSDSTISRETVPPPAADVTPTSSGPTLTKAATATAVVDPVVDDSIVLDVVDAHGHGGFAGMADIVTDPTGPDDLPKRRRKKGRGIAFWMALGWLGLVVASALFANILPVPDPDKQDLTHKLATPFGPGHILGTDGLGRDILARLVHGSRVSLIVSISAVGLGLLVGGTLGMFVGFVRGRTEAATMSVLNVMLAFPPLIILVGLVAFIGPSVPVLAMVIGFISIPTYARVARASTLSVSQREYVLASRAMGATKLRLLFSEILPNVILPVAAFGLVALGVVIVLEGSLAFLGLSVPGVPEWGGMIADGRQHLGKTAHVALIPSIVLFLTVLAINFVGDELRRRYDVRESSL
jgi:peptide/nickel transport system permease protein